MWNEEEFFDQFKNDNNKIQPSQDFKNRLNLAIEAETKSKVIPFYRDIKKISAVQQLLQYLSLAEVL